MRVNNGNKTRDFKCDASLIMRIASNMKFGLGWSTLCSRSDFPAAVWSINN